MNWLLADLFIIFSWVCVSVRSIFSIWIFFPPFSPSCIDECLHHPTIYPPIHPFIPSVGMHLLTHSLLFIVFAFIKMNFLGQSLAYILSCMPCMREISQWDGLLARLLAYTQLLIPPWSRVSVEQYSHIVPQLTEFRSIRLSFYRRSEERDSNRRWTRRSVGKNPWPLEEAWASANLR